MSEEGGGVPRDLSDGGMELTAGRATGEVWVSDTTRAETMVVLKHAVLSSGRVGLSTLI